MEVTMLFEDPLYKAMRNSFYSKVDPRRQQEMADSRMVQEDRTAMSNLPMNAIHREYNQDKFNLSPWVDDEIGR